MEQKTRKYLIATHGTFSAGVKSSLDMIAGATENVFIIQAYVDENTAIEQQINAVLQQVSDGDELIVFSDILGGSVTNQLMQLALKSNVHIVSGFNLPLLLEVVLDGGTTPADELIETSITNAKEQMVYVNKLINTENS